jgi:hypothetical protein
MALLSVTQQDASQPSFPSENPSGLINGSSGLATNSGPIAGPLQLGNEEPNTGAASAKDDSATGSASLSNAAPGNDDRPREEVPVQTLDSHRSSRVEKMDDMLTVNVKDMVESSKETLEHVADSIKETVAKINA